MKWQDVKENNFPKDKSVLVTYLNPFFGLFVEEIGIARYNFDGCNTNEIAWQDSLTNNILIVTHWMPLPEKPNGILSGIDQKEYLRKIGKL